MTPTEQTIALAPYHLSLASKVWKSSGSRLPTLALHGWLDNAASFDPVAPYLDGGDVYALDLAGHGHSEHLPAASTYSMLQYVSHAFAIADALAWEEFHVIAHSLGACIASLMAGIFPQRIRSLILIEGLGPLAVGSERLPELYAIHLSRLLALEQKRMPAYPSQSAAAAARHRGSNVTLEAAEILAARGTKQLVDGSWTWSTDPRLTLPSAHPFSEEQVNAFLQQISCPTTLILAQEGGPYDPAMMSRRQSQITSLRTELLPGSHHLHMEYPEAVGKIIAEHHRLQTRG